MPIWMAFSEHAMVSAWSWAAWAKWARRIRLCNSTRGSGQLHSEAIFTSFPVGEKGMLAGEVLTSQPTVLRAVSLGEYAIW